MDWTVHGVAKSRTQLSDFHFHFILREINVKATFMIEHGL